MGLRQHVALLTTCLALMLGSTAAMAGPGDHGHDDHEYNGRGHDNRDHDSRGHHRHEQPEHGHEFRAFGGQGRHGYAERRFHSAPSRPLYARGDRFPHGMRWHPVERRVLVDLPHRRGYEWRRVGTELILVSIATGVIYEVLQHELYN